MPDAHAHLSPSSSERWLTCPASVRLVDELYPADSEDKDHSGGYALEGTYAHELGELMAKRTFGLIGRGTYLQKLGNWRTRAQDLGYDIPEMEKHIEAYLRLLTQSRDSMPNSTVLVEQRMDTGVPECWGTSDAVIVSPTELQIVDLKYGQGVKVNAHRNTQLMLYGVAALDTYGDLLGDVETVTVTVFQPRLGHTSSYSLPARELRQWRDSIIPIAQEALAGSDTFGPSESACRWCPVAGDCRARFEAVMSTDFGRHPDILSLEEISEALGQLDMIRSWCTAVEKNALSLTLERGERVPGYKVVASGGRRTITDPTLAIQRLIDRGFKAEKVAQLRIKGLGDLEKAVGGREDLLEVIGDLVVKGEGKPTLVLDTDPRPALDPTADAIADFTD